MAILLDAPLQPVSVPVSVSPTWAAANPSGVSSRSSSTSGSGSLTTDDDDDASLVSPRIAPIPASPPPVTSLSLSTATLKAQERFIPAILELGTNAIPTVAIDQSPSELVGSATTSNANPQPFFPTIDSNVSVTIASPTTFQFPAIAEIPADPSAASTSATPHSAPDIDEQGTPTTSKRHRTQPSLSRTPSSPTIVTSPAVQNHARPPRARRQSTKVYGPNALTVGNPQSPSGGDPANQLEAKVVIRESHTLCSRVCEREVMADVVTTAPPRSVGSQGVGKTSLVHRYTTGVFSYSLTSTIGASFLAKRLVVEGCKVRLQIWDTAGQERFRSMAPLYYRGALAAILVYDITNEKSFLDIRLWMDELRRNMAPDLIIHVVGSKLDLTGQRQVELVDAQRQIAQWADELDRGDDDTPLNARERESSPSSPNRSRASTRARQGSIPGPLIPNGSTIATTSPLSPMSTAQPVHDSLGARVRKMSTKLGSLPTVATLAATNAPSGGTIGLGTNSSSTLSVHDSLAPTSENMSRSGSKMSLSLGSLGLAGRSRSRNEDDERRAAEDVEREEAARIDRLVKDCSIEVTEVSAKDDIGVEEMFVHITQRLVERKAQIESARILRSRGSIMLRDDTPNPATAGWCCA
ncbi:BZ3500_MvSof-1268-A1-R1_Chr2-1g04485 [Microbotryum saponariae]|uniref:BZ3500_MvSof-1268-A1-R1_Chr2-1g04485 protein n=1 Tax=Microbotryum saponariae TaxID=289078 RepID=A0A2X0MJD1_9BASI|nr:BZ3500_MvSof-1268-A1-R1_Chr2-1g04485 [Microbotryum saponariae]SCZ91815.1 BZ3501_MvSof-1269-A2-R1_Chr2-1g04141 [Microbotryum saponariae]